MTLELVQTSLQNSIQSVQNLKELSKMLMDTPHYKKYGAEGVFAIVSMANSLEIDAMEALNGALYYLNGKVGMSAELMARLVRRAGHSIQKDPKSDDTICILHGKRKDTGDTWSSSFSIMDAKRAGIYKNTWEKYPAAMCYNRAMTFLFRQLFADLAKSAGYLPEELEEIKESELKRDEKVKTIEIPQVEKKFLSVPQQAEVKKIFEELPEVKSKVLTVLKMKDSPNVLEQIEEINYERIVNCAVAARAAKEVKNSETLIIENNMEVVNEKCG